MNFFVLICCCLPGCAVARPPNILLLLTDDQDVLLGGMEKMPKMRKLLQRQGTTFSNMVVASPLCCPSRASILTGRYVHNHGVVNNSASGGCASARWSGSGERTTFAVSLKNQANYTTFYAGKYLNQYGRKGSLGWKHVPPGWDEWLALVGNSKYYDYSLSACGRRLERHAGDYEGDYLPKLIGDRALRFLSRHANVPVMMTLAFPSCHAPFTPSPGHVGTFRNASAPRTPSFDRHAPDKHWLVSAARWPMDARSVALLDDVYRRRLETLLSVDDVIAQIHQKLHSLNLLESSYLFFTSDNGFHLGQFSLPYDKRQLYEFDIRVPLVVRGPNVARNAVSQSLVSSVDLAPTFLDLARVSDPPEMDGRSFEESLRAGHASPPRRVLVEHRGEFRKSNPGCPKLRDQGVAECFPSCVCEDARNNTFWCVRSFENSRNSIFCRLQDDQNFREFYDLSSDPWQLSNAFGDLDPARLLRFETALRALQACRGASCHVT